MNTNVVVDTLGNLSGSCIHATHAESSIWCAHSCEDLLLVSGEVILLNVNSRVFLQGAVAAHSAVSCRGARRLQS